MSADAIAQSIDIGCDLLSFRAGDTVIKRCGPYGDGGELHNTRGYQVAQQLRDGASGQVTHVILCEVAGPSLQRLGLYKHFVLCPKFFGGWQRVQ